MLNGGLNMEVPPGFAVCGSQRGIAAIAVTDADSEKHFARPHDGVEQRSVVFTPTFSHE
jgi:hypothetical protein